jgi:hypothetical protein
MAEWSEERPILHARARTTSDKRCTLNPTETLPMDAANSLKRGYERPSVIDYGTLAELTSDVGMFLPFGIASPSIPIVPETPTTPGGPEGPGGPGGETAGTIEVSETGLGEAAPEVQGGAGGSAPAGAQAEGGGGGGGGGPVETGGEGGSLPFTGLAAGGVAAAGAALTGAGAALRRVARGRREGRM